MAREGTLCLVKNPEKIFFFPPYYYHWLTPRGFGRDGGGVGGGAPRRVPQAVAAAFEKGTTLAVSPSGLMRK
jgi:hypothetical protein